ncbi:PX-associated-domain-containing protein [Leptodontidium sp. 2 PMI_412]|nr:PX-associated-domain-containing protein [Leptodontidium sp. 2 PMI_412]
MTTEHMSPEQARALLDILSHHEAYQELRDLRLPGALSRSGTPFKTDGEPNEMPLLHALFSSFLVPLPGLRDVTPDFYQAKCQEIIEEFAKADLSESYEAGYIGIRKTLATATAALLEAPARGYYGGFPKKDLSRTDSAYDTSKPEDVVAAFQDFLQRVVYGTILDEMFVKAAETDKLEEHDLLVQAAHEYILVILASFLHYILIITPEGQTMLTMMKQANALVPYTAIRQTLKIGNVATMINAMMKLILTKMTLNSVTTFLGITNASDAGWNLLQTIIWTVVNWDTNSLKSRITEIEKNSAGPTQSQREILVAYMDKDRLEHDKCRTMSEAKSEPIVVTIMEEYGGEELNEKQIPLALDYLSAKVSLQDRKKIIAILCSGQPDLLTQAVRECVAAYDPVIRALHKAVDLSGTVSDFQAFLDDLLAFAPSGKHSPNASVGDFVRLLRKHQKSCHRFIHQVCKNGSELSTWYKEYARASASQFRVNDLKENTPVSNSGGAGKLTSQLENAVSQLPEKQKAQVLAECNAYAAYHAHLATTSKSEMIFEVEHEPVPKKLKRVFTSSKPVTREPSPTRPTPGPGMFLRRWQAYVNATAITPSQPTGPVRYGGDIDVVTAGRIPKTGAAKDAQIQAAEDKEVKDAPRCTKTVELLAARFREILREASHVSTVEAELGKAEVK